MPRPSTVLVIFIISINGTAIMMNSVGVDEMLGVNPEVDAPDDDLRDAEQQTQEINTGNSLGETLFGMYNTLASGVGTIFQLVTAGPDMLARAGVPSFLTNFLAGIFGFVIAFDVMSYIRGWGL